MRGIFSLDPGGASGLAWGIFDPSAGIREAIANGIDKGSATVEGDEYEQIKLIAEHWMVFYRHCVNYRLLKPEHVEFVCEDFVERTDLRGKEHQSPVRVMWGVEGYRMGRAAEFAGRKYSVHRVFAPRMILQHPSLGSAVDSQRLKNYGCWVKGRDHERSAWRNIIVRLGRIRQAAPVAAAVR